MMRVYWLTRVPPPFGAMPWVHDVADLLEPDCQAEPP